MDDFMKVMRPPPPLEVRSARTVVKLGIVGVLALSVRKVSWMVMTSALVLVASLVSSGSLLLIPPLVLNWMTVSWFRLVLVVEVWLGVMVVGVVGWFGV